MLGRVSKIFTDSLDQQPIHNHLDQHNQTINHLIDHQSRLTSYVAEIKQSNIKHKKEIVDQIQLLSRWIDHLHTNHLTLKKDVHAMISDLRSTIKDDFTNYHSILLHYIDSKMEHQKLTLEKKHDELISEVKKKVTQTTYQPEKKQNSINNTPQQQGEQELTSSEKLLLNTMFNQDKPMTYDELAQKMGKSINSVRVYMNALRNKRDVIEEFSTPTGKKIFSIKNAQMVKTLFNIV